MKLDLGPLQSRYVAPSFRDGEEAPDPRLNQRLRRPIVVGSAIIGAFVVGLSFWASITKIDSGVNAPGEVRVESNRKTLRHREGGTVRQILVKEGDRVRAGQPLIVFDDVQARAAVDVFQSQYDSAAAQAARYMAESTGRRSLDFPPELMSRMSDPRVAGLIRDQQFLFASRLQLFEGQNSVLQQRQEQLKSSIIGLQAQVDSIEEQRKLTVQELDGYKKLEAQGYAPKTLILRYDRALADLGGKKGQLMAEIAKTRQQIGEAQLQSATLRNDRVSQAADGVRAMQTQMADIGPRLTAALQTLAGTTMRAPVDGYVLNLTQFTIGGMAGAGETLLDVVPEGEAMIVTVQVRPQDIDEVRAGMEARVRLNAFNQRWVSPLKARVLTVSADRLADAKDGRTFFRADLRIDPSEIAKLPKNVKLKPGMPADAMIVTGERTVMGYLISPVRDTLSDAFREE